MTDDAPLDGSYPNVQLGPTGVATAEEDAVVLDHETLKYHLLGPSLTKAGQDSVDQKKVSEVIYNASKGSKFFNNEEVKDRNLTVKINRILARKRQLDKLDLAHDIRRADEYIALLELSRDLSQHVVHIDCDAFYAAVEELDRPELKDVPMAVGQGVLTTCNYHARKFGCRSGMAGFVAMKLCPELVCLPLNFQKYTAKAQEVRQVLAEYDPRFESASIDEAYLNVTEYCINHSQDPEEVVQQMRREVFEKAKITISAGIAANAKLAKICSNKNKPNGQFKLANDRSTIMAFMRDLPTRKVNGIGRVFERELDAIGIRTCGDMYAHRGQLSKLFGEKAFQFLMTCHLGLGRTSIQPAEDYERKSVGTESTFRDMSDKTELRAKLRHIAEELEKDLERTRFKGRTLVLKIKLHTYEVFTRQMVPPKAVHVADDLYKYSLPMLAKLEKDIPGLRLRLMGLRVTHLVNMKKEGVDFFGFGRQDGVSMNDNSNVQEAAEGSYKDDGAWEAWPDSEFEAAARQERQDEMNDVLALSQEAEKGSGSSNTDLTSRRRHGREVVPNPKPLDSQRQQQQLEPALTEEESWQCPVCGRPQTANDRAFNEHIDLCLSRQTIQEVVKSTTSTEVAPTQEQSIQNKGTASTRKRGRPAKAEPRNDVNRPAKKLFFFS